MTGPRTPASPSRRIVPLLVAVLLGALLPLGLGATSPAAAAGDCLDETYSYTAPPPFSLLPVGCDDTVAPSTVLTSVSPAVGSQGYLRTPSLTVAFAGAHPDADTGALSFECQLYDTAAAPATWTACTSPATYSGLADTAALPYTFRVRAVDTTDAGIAACDDSPDLLNPGCADEEPLAPDGDDVDASPATFSFRLDSVAPNTFLNRQPVDPIRPDWPVLLTSTPTLEVNSNEPGTFACTLNGRSFTPCGPGSFTLRDLAPGDNTLVARAIDPAGNPDLTPATATFFLPANIKSSKGSGWRTQHQAGLFGGDFVESRTVGATLVVAKVRNVREVRLIAPVGPRFGTIQVRVGSSQWYAVDLHAKHRRIAQLVVRDQYSPLQSGKIQVRVVSLRGPTSSVRLDAIVARD